MATDKKINELPVSAAVSASDVSVLVRNGTDYQFSFDAWREFIEANTATGAGITFGTTLPQNNLGKNGDIFFNTGTNAIAQKISGTWVNKYSFPSQNGTQDGTILYGMGIPGPTVGKNGDTFIDTTSGVFYQRSTSLWSPVFSMQTGPAGAKGDKGDIGAAGAAGKSILNGSNNPSNINTGTNGDFYINTRTLTFFGPKADNDWGTGIPLAQRASNEIYLSNTATPALENWQQTGAAIYGNYPRVILLIEDEEKNEITAPGISPTYTIDRSDPANPLVTDIRWELAFPTNCRILIN